MGGPRQSGGRVHGAVGRREWLCRELTLLCHWWMLLSLSAVTLIIFREEILWPRRSQGKTFPNVTVRIAWLDAFAHHWEEIQMGFILFMIFIPFLNDTKVSLMISGCYCEYILTMAILKICTKMAKIYGIPSSIKNFCFLKRKIHCLNVYRYAV